MNRETKYVIPFFPKTYVVPHLNSQISEVELFPFPFGIFANRTYNLMAVVSIKTLHGLQSLIFLG